VSQSLANVLIHIVFSTKKRMPWIDNEIESKLHRYISVICADNDSSIFQIGGMSDHIHLLLPLSRTLSPSKLISEIKSQSSRWIKTQGLKYRDFSWQSGYGVFSVGQSGKKNAIEYIVKQKEHHQNLGFQDEFRILLKKYEISFNEEYLWD
jgi:putative transposase